jgi:hypothetical protein
MRPELTENEGRWIGGGHSRTPRGRTRVGTPRPPETDPGQGSGSGSRSDPRGARGGPSAVPREAPEAR